MITVPDGYVSKLGLYDTQNAIGKIKQTFFTALCENLNLKRATAPLFVESNTGINDDLNGVERPVKFDIKATGGYAEVVHSLAKWKRLALKRYDFYVGKGLITDMNAIRRDEDLDNLHSIYVDQWDWEKVITKEDRNFDYLKKTVGQIVDAIITTRDALVARYPELDLEIKKDIKFITSQELEDMYPSLTPKEREYEIVKEYKTVFIMQIGGKLKSGIVHDGRAPDYDDWALNGDLLFYHKTLDTALEVSSMGIRVDAESLDKQLKLAGCDNRRNLMYHKMLLNNELPLTIGGGIGQSRLCMFLLEKAHIGEVQASVWDDETVKYCNEKGVILL